MNSRDKRLHIGAWVAPPPKNFNGLNNDEFITDEQYQLIKASGIDVIYGLYENGAINLNDILRALDLAKKHHIGYLVRDDRIHQANHPEVIDDLLKDYAFHPAFRGLLAFDEPGLSQFEALKSKHNLIQLNNPSLLFYTNILPLYATKEQLMNGAASTGDTPATLNDYHDYVNDYITTIKPSILSYDFYPFMHAFPSVHTDYFIQLDVMMTHAKKHQLPLWCFIQTCSFNHQTRIPTYTEILWQVNTSLAFGHTGIQYFTYFLPIEGGQETFTGAMIDLTGAPTQTYEDVKVINQYLNTMHHLTEMTWQGMIVSEDTQKLYNIPSTHIIPRHDISITESNHVLMACLDHHNHQYGFIMNLSLTESIKPSVSSPYESNKIISLHPAESKLIRLK